MLNDYLLPVLVVGGTGLVGGVMLSVAAKYMGVKKDERFDKVRECLPGANCGGCGYAGCDDYAQKILEGAPCNLCNPGGAETAARIAAVMGVEVGEFIPKYAVVHCGKECEKTALAMDYQGVPSCEAAAGYFGGKYACKYSCLGFGDCVLACEYDAIHVVNGTAVVDKSKCSGCGQCVKTCPKHIIELIPCSKNYYIACSSKDKGPVTRKNCETGCIACKKCERTCPVGAITVADFLSHIDYTKCISCGKCMEVCPTGAILSCFAAIPAVKAEAAAEQEEKPAEPPVAPEGKTVDPPEEA